MHCSNCGANLEIDGSTQTPVCAFCKHQNLLPEDVWQRFHPPPPPFAALTAPPKPDWMDSPKLNIVAIAIGAVAAIVVAVVARQSSPPTPPPRAVAEPGSPCGATKSACASDGKSLLVCDGSKLVVALTCKGPNGCRVTARSHSTIASATCATTLPRASWQGRIARAGRLRASR